jgi:hypothetical protein
VHLSWNARTGWVSLNTADTLWNARTDWDAPSTDTSWDAHTGWVSLNTDTHSPIPLCWFPGQYKWAANGEVIFFHDPNGAVKILNFTSVLRMLREVGVLS